MRSNFLFLMAVFILAACSQKFSNSPEGLVLSTDFNNKNDKVFSPTHFDQLKFSHGLEKRGLDMENSRIIPALKDADTAWFSNTNDFSISVWVKSENNKRDTTIILSNADFRKKDMGIYGKRRINKGFSLYSYNGGWGWNIGNGRLHYNYEPMYNKQPIANNKWHHLAFTYNSKLHEVRLFYDGVNKAVLHIGDLKNSDFKSKFPLRIGEDKNVSSTCKSFQGTIDELKVWAKIVSPDAIRDEFEYYSKSEVKEPEIENDIITVVNWNIWHGGTHFLKDRDGFDGVERIIKMIKDSQADIVLMQETYGAGSKISSCLGYYYYEASSTIGAVWGANLSIMSRFPIEEVYMIEERSNYGKNYAFNNGGAKIRLSNNKSVIAFTNWYNGRKPEDLEGALKGWAGLIDQCDLIPIIYGGDFNSISHLDDGEGKSGHSKLMAEAGFIDTYRKLFPDAKSHPGYTAGRFEDRIDYIYFKGNKLTLVEAMPIDPNFRGKEERTPGYPSDHLGLVAKFKIN